MLRCLSPWGDNIFWRAACKSICAFLFSGDETACPSAAVYIKIPSRYVTLTRCLDRRADRSCSSGHFSCCVQSLCVCFASRYSPYCRLTHWSSVWKCQDRPVFVVSAKICLVMVHIVGLVGPEELDHVSLFASNCRHWLGIVGDRKENSLWSKTQCKPGRRLTFCTVHRPDLAECTWHEAVVVANIFYSSRSCLVQCMCRLIWGKLPPRGSCCWLVISSWRGSKSIS